jgi:superfamily I DNA/RNA helicase
VEETAATVPNAQAIAAATAGDRHPFVEFRAVVVMACDQDVLPLESRIAEAADEGELDDIYETERQLLYVACTRARDRLLVTGVTPGSEFLKDL